MIKITTLFKKNPENLGRVINEINPCNEWVFEDKGVKATRKYDGTACAIIDGMLYKRYDVKKGRDVPEGAIPCQGPDLITGHWPHWVLCDNTNPADKYFLEALGNQAPLPNGTYELIGEKVQGNPEKITGHKLVRHGESIIATPDWESVPPYHWFEYFFKEADVEGIVFHHPDGRMCKIRKSDFGIKR